MNAASIVVGGVIPAEAAGCCSRAADALVPVRVINVDLADLVLG
jgi:hypothetical protein